MTDVFLIRLHLGIQFVFKFVRGTICKTEFAYIIVGQAFVPSLSLTQVLSARFRLAS